MSLAINPERVIRILLADGWHDCADASFDLDAYEFIEQYDKGKTRTIFGGGQDKQVPSTGFVFTDTESGNQLFGPITSIIAVETI
jgi:hypothetical protein